MDFKNNKRKVLHFSLFDASTMDNKKIQYDGSDTLVFTKCRKFLLRYILISIHAYVRQCKIH